MRQKLALLHDSEDQFRAIYEQAPLGITLVDFHTGRFIRWNRKFCEIVQRTPEELAQLDFQSITHPDDLPENMHQMEEIRAGNRDFFAMEKRYLLPDGSNIWINITVMPMWTEQGGLEYYIGMIEDITARKHAEASMKRQAEFDTLITTVLSRFASCVGASAIDHAIQTSLKEIAVFSGAEIAYLSLCSKDLSCWNLAYQALPPGTKRKTRHLADIPMGVFPWIEQRILSGHTVEIQKLDDFPPEGEADRREYAAAGVKSVLLVPLRGHGGQVAGSIGLRAYSRPLVWSEEDVGRYRIVADAIANTLERKRVEGALYESRQMLQQILDTIPQRVFWKDRELRFLGCNKPFAMDASFSEVHDIIGKNDFEMPWAVGNAEAYRADDRLVIESGLAKMGYEEQQVRRNGTLCWLRTSKVPLRGADGRIFGILGTYEDITDFRKTSDDLRVAKELAEAANRAKDQFIAVLSHELRTPLTPVMAIVSALQEQANFPKHLQDDVEMIRRNVELEARLIDDLLDATRISQGKVTLHHEYVDIHECLRSAEGFCNSGIASKRIAFELNLDAADAFVWGDQVRIRQVFWNLLQNAVKFTPEHGKIRIHTYNENERVKVWIVDNGIGIEREAMKRIFNPFEQGEKTWTRRFGGLGLGLSIAKGIVDLHHGSLTVTSEGKDKGAAFTVDLPVVKPAMRPSKETAPVGPILPAATKILLVDDHVDTLRILARLLRRWGYSVTTAESVQSALREATGQKFDLLISDLGLPDGSGRDIIKALKSRASIRAIALSGYGTDEDIRSSMEAGFDEHLTKPVSFQALQMAAQRLAVQAISTSGSHDP